MLGKCSAYIIGCFELIGSFSSGLSTLVSYISTTEKTHQIVVPRMKTSNKYL